MQTLKLAYYVGKGNWIDKLIRWKTGDRESHVELVFSDGASFSSSPRDNGVRFKKIKFNPEHWEFDEIEVNDITILKAYCFGRIGRKYDFLSTIFGSGFEISLEDKLKDSCVEAVGDALCFDRSSFNEFNLYSVGDFRKIIKAYNGVSKKIN